MSISLSTTKDCRAAYREILQGFTYVEEERFYIKHFKETDLCFIETFYKNCLKRAFNKGLPSKKEKLTFLKKEGLWSDERESEFIKSTLAVKDAYEFLNKLHNPEQKKHFKENNLSKEESKLKEIQKDRNDLLEPSVESFCEKELNELYIYHAFFKDAELKIPFFTQEEFDNLSSAELGEVIKVYNNEISKFSELNIKKICINSFFLNVFFMCDDDPVKFFGKNVLDLTMYQLNIFSRGKYYKSILIEGKNPPDHYYEEDYENGLYELVKWYDNAHQSIINEREIKMNQARNKRGR